MKVNISFIRKDVDPASPGFTLVETIVVLVVLVIFLVVTAQLFIASNRIVQSQGAVSRLQTDAIAASSTMTTMIQHAESILQSQKIQGVSYTTSQDTVVLRVPAIDSSQQILSGIYDFAVFYRDPLDPPKLFLGVEADSRSFRKNQTRLLTDVVKKLIFHYNETIPSQGNLIRFYFELEKNVGRSIESYRVQSSTRLRN